MKQMRFNYEVTSGLKRYTLEKSIFFIEPSSRMFLSVLYNIENDVAKK